MLVIDSTRSLEHTVCRRTASNIAPKPSRQSTTSRCRPRPSRRMATTEEQKDGQLQLYRRTSVRIESEPNRENSDTYSTISSLASKETKVLRGFRLRLGTIPNGPLGDRGSGVHDSQASYDSGEWGTTVVIEASRPFGSEGRSRRDMKGLDQAASMFRWIGNAQSPEPWGKLLKARRWRTKRGDPRLMCCTGPRIMEPYWRHLDLLRLPASRAFLPYLLLGHRGHQVRYTHLHAS